MSDFPGVCDKCPLGLICSSYSSYEEKHLCHCRECKQVIMVFREIGMASIMKDSKTKKVNSYVKALYREQTGKLLIGSLGDFDCPHPYTGYDCTCPDCDRERRLKKIE